MSSEAITRNDLKAVLNEVLPSEPVEADYVVEQGTSGIWTYRKWSSGIAECWCNKTVTINFSQNITSSLYTTGDITRTPYPDIFTSIDNVICAGYNPSSYGWATLVSGGAYTPDKTVITGYMGWTGAGANTLNLSINIKGRWK